MKQKMIRTPYGPKNEETICKALDALENQREILFWLEQLVKEADEQGGRKRTVTRYTVDMARNAIANVKGIA